jgi:hypothetical protein
MHTTDHNIKLYLVKLPPEIKVQLQHSPIERTSKPSSMPILPWMPYNPKRDILVWRTGRKDDQLCIIVAWYTLEFVDWSFGFIATMSAQG